MIRGRQFGVGIRPGPPSKGPPAPIECIGRGHTLSPPEEPAVNHSYATPACYATHRSGPTQVLASGITWMIFVIHDHAAVMFRWGRGLCEQSPRTDDPARRSACMAGPGRRSANHPVGSTLTSARQAWDYAQLGGSSACRIFERITQRDGLSSRGSSYAAASRTVSASSGSSPVGGVSATSQ
jgi:hypothetical protein